MGILAAQNLYSLHCFMEVFKIIKFQSPSSLLASFTFSRRKYLTHHNLLPPTPDNQFIYNSSIIWNIIREKLDINDLSISSEIVKGRVRNALHKNQHHYHNIEWLPSHDFDLGKLNQVQ